MFQRVSERQAIKAFRLAQDARMALENIGYDDRKLMGADDIVANLRAIEGSIYDGTQQALREATA